MNQMSTTQYYCTIFKIPWGYFGICGTNAGITRTSLPVKTKSICQKLLTKGLKNVVFDKSIFSSLQKSVTAYYMGHDVDFGNVPLDLSAFSPFTRKVLKTCAKVSYGQTITYKQLARLAGNPNAARAVGAVMARNSMPLIIPCHRVLASDGSLHGFSAPGGLETKQKMLRLECSYLHLAKSFIAEYNPKDNKVCQHDCRSCRQVP
jgi:methylated-DNA-[protein]-cysteine S-methyltransferase